MKDLDVKSKIVWCKKIITIIKNLLWDLIKVSFFIWLI